jgi:hypothetical protein
MYGAAARAAGRRAALAAGGVARAAAAAAARAAAAAAAHAAAPAGRAAACSLEVAPRVHAGGTGVAAACCTVLRSAIPPPVPPSTHPCLPGRMQLMPACMHKDGPNQLCHHGVSS